MSDINFMSGTRRLGGGQEIFAAYKFIETKSGLFISEPIFALERSPNDKMSNAPQHGLRLFVSPEIVEFEDYSLSSGFVLLDEDEPEELKPHRHESEVIDHYNLFMSDTIDGSSHRCYFHDKLHILAPLIADVVHFQPPNLPTGNYL